MRSMYFGMVLGVNTMIILTISGSIFNRATKSFAYVHLGTFQTILANFMKIRERIFAKTHS